MNRVAWSFSDYPPATVFGNKQYQSIDNLTTVCKCGHWYHLHTIMTYPAQCVFRDCDCLAFKEKKKENLRK